MEKTKPIRPEVPILGIVNRFTKQFLTQQNILEYLKLGPAPRSDICRDLDLAWTTSYDNLRELKAQGVVIKYRDPEHNRKGRPLTFWALKPKEED